MKQCGVCRQNKPLSEFHKCSTSKDGVQHRCKPCACALASKWTRDNPERANANARAWCERNRERRKEITRLSFQRNYTPERGRKAGRERIKGGKYYAWQLSVNAARRAKAKQATPAWANKFFIEQAYDIARKRSDVTGVKWEVDHIVPLKSDLVCGLHVESNLRVIPAWVNRSKKNRYWPDMPA